MVAVEDLSEECLAWGLDGLGGVGGLVMIWMDSLLVVDKVGELGYWSLLRSGQETEERGLLSFILK
jgi:hypothetical protein